MTGKVGRRQGWRGGTAEHCRSETVSAKPVGSFRAKVAYYISSKFFLERISVMKQPPACHIHHSSARLLHHLNWGPVLPYFPSSLFPSQPFINGNKKRVHHISATRVWPLPSDWCQRTSRPEESIPWQPGTRGVSCLIAMTSHLALERSLISCWIVRECSCGNLLNSHMGPCIVFISVNLFCLSSVGRD